ncbi:MAG: hypothetical protein J5858_10510, partial [Lentisphaeria bacterium]|nr:hypothetical protein [Lentisphaeria bacterium]
LQVKVQGLRPRKTHWLILAANVGIGLSAWLLASLSGSRDLAHAAFFTGINPTASAAPVIMRFLGGDVEFVVTSFLTTNIGVSLSLTGLIPLVTGNFTLNFLLNVVWNLFFLIGIPMTAAFLVRRIYPKAKELVPKLANFSFMLWISMLFLTASSASEYIRKSAVSPMILLEIAGLSALICAINFTLGYFFAGKNFNRESSQSLGQKNTMFTLSLALTFSGPLAALGPTFYVLWHNLWNGMQLFLHDRQKNRNRTCENCEAGYIEKKKTDLKQTGDQ